MTPTNPTLPSDAWPRPRPLIILALIALYAASLVRDLDAPFVGLHDWNGAFYSYLARNLLRYPLEITHLLPVAEMGPVPPKDAAVSIYANHPPGIEWTLAIVFALFGDNERTARLVPIAFSLASLWLLMRITAGALGRPTAAVACLLYAVMPLSAFFGRGVDQEAPCLFFMLLAAWGWYASLGIVATSATPRMRRAMWMIGLAGGILMDWVGLLVAAAFFIEAAWRAHRRQCSRATLAFAAIIPALTLAGVLLLLVYGGLNGSWRSLLDLFISRSDAAAASADRPILSPHGGPWNATLENFSAGILVLALLGLPFLIARGPASSRGRPRSRAPLALMTAVGAAWVLIFWPQFLRHNYWQFYLGPSVCIAAAAGLVGVHRIVSARRPRAAEIGAVLALGVTAALALHGTNYYFKQRSFTADNVDAWRSVNAMLRPSQRVVLFSDPVRYEHHGIYVYRNIVPPQLVYYLDREFAVARGAAEIERLAGDGAVLMIPAERLGNAAQLLKTLNRRFPRYMLHPFMIVDLDPALRRVFGDRVG